MKNIHVLPTDKPSRLYFDVVVKELLLQNRVNVNPTSFPIEKRHIYITNDEEIKNGDWFITKTNDILKVQKPEKSYDPIGKKIILTTDQDLIKDGVQAIDDEFLEWLVKNPSCESVEVDSWSDDLDGYWLKKYKIIIPKEEPKKVLTEEDIFNQKDIDAVTDYINKEQQKQHLIDMMESDEELELYDESREIKFEEVFNDEKKENIKKFIDEIKNPSEPNQALKDAAERLKGKELFKESNDRARKILSEIKSLPKQETLQEAAEKYRINTIKSGRSHRVEYTEQIKLDFIEGAKWMQERMYSEEEVKRLAFDFYYDMSHKMGVPINLISENATNVDVWFEQFKKK